MTSNAGATLRETGTGESERPTPHGDYTGLSRAKALDLLLAKHEQAQTEKSVGTKTWFERLGEVLSLMEVE